MNILLTNDDGIESPGILILEKIFSSRLKHNIFVLAPDRNCSGVSHGLSILNEPLELTEKENRIWHCNGLPADCVIAAILGGKPCKPDLVISGINRGPNMGNDIIYSGTCAAARQAVLSGVPGIALSLEGPKDRGGKYLWEEASVYFADHLEEFMGLWRPDIFINVNHPSNSVPSGMKITWPAVKDYHDSVLLETNTNGKARCLFQMGNEKAEYEEGSDCEVISGNFVSVSPVCVYPVVRRDLCAGVPDYASAGARKQKNREAANE